MQNRICQLLGIEIPIVQAGMIWCSGWKLAAAVSEAGGLGAIGAGSMYPNILEEHIIKCKQSTNNPFAVNLPLLNPSLQEHMEIIIKHKVPIVITSAGNPSLYTEKLKAHQIKVMHVVSNTKFAQKAEAAGVDAIIAEGFEAGGHNGREETTTLCLIPMVANAVKLPVIAAGGIATGQAMAACIALGAEAVQIGSRFVASHKSSAHEKFKQAIIKSHEGDTRLMLKKLTPVRLLENKFSQEIEQAEQTCASPEQLSALLGRGRAKLGMFEGNLEQGELEIGQVSATIKQIENAKDILHEIWHDFQKTIHELALKW